MLVFAEEEVGGGEGSEGVRVRWEKAADEVEEREEESSRREEDSEEVVRAREAVDEEREEGDAEEEEAEVEEEDEPKHNGQTSTPTPLLTAFSPFFPFGVAAPSPSPRSAPPPPSSTSSSPPTPIPFTALTPALPGPNIPITGAQGKTSPS